MEAIRQAEIDREALLREQEKCVAELKRLAEPGALGSQESSGIPNRDGDAGILQALAENDEKAKE